MVPDRILGREGFFTRHPLGIAHLERWVRGFLPMWGYKEAGRE
jgi:hypothetical protein